MVKRVPDIVRAAPKNFCFQVQIIFPAWPKSALNIAQNTCRTLYVHCSNVAQNFIEISLLTHRLSLFKSKVIWKSCIDMAENFSAFSEIDPEILGVRSKMLSNMVWNFCQKVAELDPDFFSGGLSGFASTVLAVLEFDPNVSVPSVPRTLLRYRLGALYEFFVLCTEFFKICSSSHLNLVRKHFLACLNFTNNS